MEFVTKVVECVNTFLWDYALLILLLGAGIIYSFSLKFIQVRKFGAGMKALFGNFSLHGGKGENGLSSFQALTTAIAAQVGTGNIAGAATAIASGGLSFWPWDLWEIWYSPTLSVQHLTMHSMYRNWQWESVWQ